MKVNNVVRMELKIYKIILEKTQEKKRFNKRLDENIKHILKILLKKWNRRKLR